MQVKKNIKAITGLSLALLAVFVIAGCSQKNQTNQEQKINIEVEKGADIKVNEVQAVSDNDFASMEDDVVIREDEDVIDVILDSNGETTDSEMGA